MTLGYPGSGKTFTAEWLSSHMEAVHMRSDDLRVAFLGPDKPENHTPEKKNQVNNALYYIAGQIAAAGCSLILDANYNSFSTRQRFANLARKYAALPVIVWVKTDMELAKQRAEQRAQDGGFDLLEPNLIEKMAKRLEPPTDNELVIEIDGHVTAAEQRASFDEQLTELRPLEEF